MDLVPKFNPDESAKIVREKLSSWNRMTVEIVDELYRAKDHYSNSGFRSDLVPSGTRLVTFEAYLEQAGLPRRTAYNWLERYIPEEHKLLTYEELTEKKNQERLAKLSQEERDRKLIAEFRKTGTKPVGWSRDLDYRIKKDSEAEIKQKERIEKANQEREQRSKEYKEQQSKINTTTENIFAGAFQKAADSFIHQSQKKAEWKEKIRLSDCGKEDAFMDAIIEYLETLESDTRRIEACNNIIKICRNISIELQSVKAA